MEEKMLRNLKCMASLTQKEASLYTPNFQMKEQGFGPVSSCVVWKTVVLTTAFSSISVYYVYEDGLLWW